LYFSFSFPLLPVITRWERDLFCHLSKDFVGVDLGLGLVLISLKHQKQKWQTKATRAVPSKLLSGPVDELMILEFSEWGHRHI
jgi:hypothetical protein